MSPEGERGVRETGSGVGELTCAAVLRCTKPSFRSNSETGREAGGGSSGFASRIL